jgi:predicted O-methyltransferase YrrM
MYYLLAMSLDEFYNSKGITHFEGHSGEAPDETAIIRKIVTEHAKKNVMEIGFNAGHSAHTILSANPDIHLTSFDLGNHEYTVLGKEWIDWKYPGRHTIILGDSRETVSSFVEERDTKFDVIFVDGGHEGDIPMRDMQNSMLLSHRDTIVILDDVRKIGVHSWNIQPNRVWHTLTKRGIVKEMGQGDFEPRHGLAWGKFSFDTIA